jgi:hypothetical protein
MKFLLAALALAFVQPEVDTIQLTLAKGAKLTKSWSLTLEMELDEFGLRVGDRDAPAEMLEQAEMTTSFGQLCQVEDEYVSVQGARTTELVRHFSKASQSNKSHFVFPGVPPKDEDKDVESPLLDHSVSFTWDDKEEKYTPAYKGEEGEKSCLEELKAETDYAQLLPPAAVEAGETWKIEPKWFEEITTPGGSLSFPGKKDDDDLFDDEMKGTIEARYDGKREVDGREFSVIHLSAALRANGEVESDGLPMKMEFGFEVEGDYLWDIEHGRLSSFELVGPANLQMAGSKELEANGQKLTMSIKFLLKGECKIVGKFD